MAKPNKRIRNKKHKQLIHKKAVTYNIVEEPKKVSFAALEKLVQKEEKRRARNEQKKAQRAARREYALKAGIPADIISKNRLYDLSEENLQKFAKQYKRKQAAAELIARKKQMIMAKGYTEAEAEKMAKKLTLDQIREMNAKGSIALYAKQYLTVLWFDPTTENGLSHALTVVNAMSEYEKKDLIERTKAAKSRTKTGYEKFLGDYLAAKGTLDYCEKVVNKSRRLPEPYTEILLPTNKFSKRGIENLLATMSQILVPHRIADFYDYMQIFVEDNFPEWLDIFK